MEENLIEQSVLPVIEEQPKPNPKPVSYISGLRSNLISAYGDNSVPDEATFTKKITSDPKYLKNIHENLIHAYGQENVPDINIFTDKVKKKELSLPSGEISSLTELPSEFIAPLKKGVNPNPSAEEEKLAKRLGVTSSKGMITPTNLPKQDAVAYERQLNIKEGALNTLKDLYKSKGLTFNPNSKRGQEQVQEYIDKEKNNDLGLVQGMQDKKPYLTRTAGLGESFVNSLVSSFKEPIESFKINMTSNPSELADLLDEKNNNQPNIPETVPSKFAGYYGGLIGGLPKMMGELAIPYVGESLMAGEMYHNSIANQRASLYQKGIDQGMSREEAATKAMESAPITAIPEAVLGAFLAKAGEGSQVLKEGTKNSFKEAAKNFVKSVPKMTALGSGAEVGRGVAEYSQGYEVDPAKVIEDAFKSGGEWGLMDAAFKIVHAAPYVPKYLLSAAKNVLSEVPKPVLEAEASKFENKDKIISDVDNFAKTKEEVQKIVPVTDDKIASVTGVTEKIQNLNNNIKELEEKKKTTTESLHPYIDGWIKEYQDEIDFYKKQMNKIVESKDATGMNEEIDDITGKRASEVPIQHEPIEIGGLKVIKRAQDAPNGEPVYEVEGERFLTADGKELKIAKVELPIEEVKPTEEKEPSTTSVITPEENIPVETIEITPENPIKVNKPTVEIEQEEPKKRTVGISHESLSKLAKRLGLKEPESGTFLSNEEQANRGRKLIENGADPIGIAEKFKEDKLVNADNISVVRAHLENLVNEADAIGYGNPGYDEAINKVNDWTNNVLKPMATESGATLAAHAGERDLDTGSFTAVSKRLSDIVDRELTNKERKEVERLTNENQTLKKKAEEAEAKLIEATNKEFSQENEPNTEKKYKAKAKNIADEFRKLKTKEFTFKDENGNDIPVQKAGAGWNDLVELGAKAIEKTGEIADGIKAIIDEIKDKDWYINLSKSDKQNLEKDLSKHFEDVFKNNVPSDDISKLQEQFVDKKGNKFTTDEAKAIWNYTKKNYIDKGIEYSESLRRASEDLGLTWEQVANAVVTPKLKPISDELFIKRSAANKNREATKRWIDEKDKSKLSKFWKKFIGFPKAAMTFGHGHVFIGTHAAQNLTDPRYVGKTLKGMVKAFTYSYGNQGNYERDMQALKNDANFVKAKKAGLANDPDNIHFDEEQSYQNFIKKVGKTGERGFNAVKVLRQQMFNVEYNKLTEAEKQNPKVLKRLAGLINNWTGATNLKTPNWVKDATFSSSMEGSRWERIANGPKAATYAIKGLMGNATPDQKAFAKVWFKRAGRSLGTYMSLLAANAAVQSITNPDKKINFTDPTKSDFLLPKFGNHEVTIDLSAGLLSSIGLLSRLGKYSFGNEKGLPKGKSRGQSMLEATGSYARGKLSPSASIGLEAATNTDFGGNVVPWSSDKPKTGKRQLGYGEYITGHFAPLPIAEGFRIMEKSAEEKGISKPQLEDIKKGLAVAAFSGALGIKTKELRNDIEEPEQQEKIFNYKEKGRPATEAEIKDFEEEKNKIYNYLDAQTKKFGFGVKDEQTNETVEKAFMKGTKNADGKDLPVATKSERYKEINRLREVATNIAKHKKFGYKIETPKDVINDVKLDLLRRKRGTASDQIIPEDVYNQEEKP